jgi:tRNA/tmRNA/rRNA uracil-C5-methylase (TrmA/RlmC/RlmD family)
MSAGWSCLVQDVTHSASGVAGFATFDMAFPGTIHPDRITVEITDDIPHVIRGLLEHSAVISLCHMMLL